MEFINQVYNGFLLGAYCGGFIVGLFFMVSLIGSISQMFKR